MAEADYGDKGPVGSPPPQEQGLQEGVKTQASTGVTLRSQSKAKPGQCKGKPPLGPLWPRKQPGFLGLVLPCRQLPVVAQCFRIK